MSEENQHTAEVSETPVPPAAAPETPAASEWPPDWRDRFAGEDKTFRRQLERYASPTDLARKARSLERKLSSGEYRRDLPADASIHTNERAG